jgi:hypothetical protein
VEKPSKLNAIATVIELELTGPPEVAKSNLALDVAKPSYPALYVNEYDLALKDGRKAYFLPALYADLQIYPTPRRQAPLYDFWEADDGYIGYWTDLNSSVSWTINVPEEGNYSVEIAYSCLKANAGSRLRVELQGGAAVERIVKSTVTRTDYKLPLTQYHTERLGEIEIPAGGADNFGADRELGAWQCH